MMTRGRAYRRAEFFKAVKRAEVIVSAWNTDETGALDPRLVGIRAATPRNCSCLSMCANPRRQGGKDKCSQAERRSKEDGRAQVALALSVAPPEGKR